MGEGEYVIVAYRGVGATGSHGDIIRAFCLIPICV